MTKKGEEASNQQAKAFIDAARALGCDESEEAFNANLKKVASHKPDEGKRQRRTPGTKK